MLRTFHFRLLFQIQVLLVHSPFLPEALSFDENCKRANTLLVSRYVTMDDHGERLTTTSAESILSDANH